MIREFRSYVPYTQKLFIDFNFHHFCYLKYLILFSHYFYMLQQREPQEAELKRIIVSIGVTSSGVFWSSLLWSSERSWPDDWGGEVMAETVIIWNERYAWVACPWIILHTGDDTEKGHLWRIWAKHVWRFLNSTAFENVQWSLQIHTLI